MAAPPLDFSLPDVDEDDDAPLERGPVSLPPPRPGPRVPAFRFSLPAGSAAPAPRAAVRPPRPRPASWAAPRYPRPGRPGHGPRLPPSAMAARPRHAVPARGRGPPYPGRGPPPRAPPPRPAPRAGVPRGHAAPTLRTILVNPRQMPRGRPNPLLNHVTTMPWAPDPTISADFVVGQHTGVVFISLKFWSLQPQYLDTRLREVRRNYKAIIVLCHVDVADFVNPLEKVTLSAFHHECTLIAAQTHQELGRYLDTMKLYEHKSAAAIQERAETEFMPQVRDLLTSVRSVNKTDAATLQSTFSTFKDIANASLEDLSLLPGFGEKKVRRLFDAFHAPFVSDTARESVKAGALGEDVERAPEGAAADAAAEPDGASSMAGAGVGRKRRRSTSASET